MISEKLDWIRLKKKLTSFEELSPLNINIEQIYTLPQDLKINDDGTFMKNLTVPNNNNGTRGGANDNNIRDRSRSKSPLREVTTTNTDKETKKKELRDLLNLNK